MGVLFFFWPLDALSSILRVRRIPRLRERSGGSAVLWMLDSPVSLLVLALALLLVAYYHTHPNAALVRCIAGTVGVVLAFVALFDALRAGRLHPYLVAEVGVLVLSVIYGAQGGLLGTAAVLFLLQGYEETLWSAIGVYPPRLETTTWLEETAGELYGSMDAAALLSVGMWWHLVRPNTLDGDVWLGVSFGVALLLTIGVGWGHWRIPPLTPLLAFQRLLVTATLREDRIPA